MAETDLSRIVRELKKQRGQIDRAIAALETIIHGSRGRKYLPEGKEEDSSAQKANGTTGKVVPFRRQI